MQLTLHTDYALRLLIRLAQNHAADGLVQIADIASEHDISLAHLRKVANQLGRLGFIETVRGRGGGIRLAREPSRITLAEVVQATEPGMDLVNCAGCGLAPGGCRLPDVFAQGLRAFMDVLSRHTLADALERPEQYASLVTSR